MNKQFRTWLKNMTVEEIAKINKRVATVLRLSQQNHTPPPDACPKSFGQGAKAFSCLSREITPDERCEAIRLISALRRYQKSCLESDSVFCKRVPELGSFKTWGYRMVVGDFEELNMRRWYPRLKLAVARLDSERHGWRKQESEPDIFSTLDSLVAILEQHQMAAKLGNKAFSARCGFSRQSWLRLMKRDWFVLPVKIWQPRLEQAIGNFKV